MKYRFLFAGILVALAACNTTNPTQLADVAVSFTRGTPGATAASFDLAGATAANALVITSAELVLREIELKRADVTDCVQRHDAVEFPLADHKPAGMLGKVARQIPNLPAKARQVLEPSMRGIQSSHADLFGNVVSVIGRVHVVNRLREPVETFF